MMHNRISEGGQVAPVTVVAFVAAVPQLARDELVHRYSVLDHSLVAKIGVLIVSDDMALQVREGVHDRATRGAWLQSWLRNITSQIKGERVLHVLNPQIA